MNASRHTPTTISREARRRRRWSAVAASTLSAAVLLALATTTPIAAALTGGDGTTPREQQAPQEYLEQWLWPVEAPIRVVSPFRAPPSPYKAGHRGIDLQAVVGAAVVAPAAGVVSFAGMVAGRPVVAIDHGDGVVSAIEPVAAVVQAGATVAAGEAIGTVSSGGHCAAGCVHFGVRVDGEYVSPFLFLGGLPRAVLLPSS